MNLPSEEELDAVEKQMREFPRFGRMPGDSRWMQLSGVEPSTIRAAQLISALRARIGEQDRALREVGEKLENHTLHRSVCNARHDRPIGGDMCICLPPELRVLRPKLDAANARAEAARADVIEEVAKAIEATNETEPSLFASTPSNGVRLMKRLCAAAARALIQDKP